MMKSVLFVYRILLPPLFFWRACFSRPGEVDSGQYQVEYKNEQLLGQRYGAKNSFSNVFSATFSSNRNFVSEFVKMDSISSRKMSTLKSLKLNSEIHKASSNLAYTMNAKDNHTVIKKHPIHKEWRSYGGHFPDRHLSQSKETRRQASMKDLPHLSLTERVPVNTYGNSQIGARLSDDLSDNRFQHPFLSAPNYSKTSRSNRTVRNRTRRATNEMSLLKHVKLRSSSKVPSEYMVRLFQLLAGTHYQMMRNIVVTCFTNIKEDEELVDNSGSTSTDIHKFVFDVNLPQNWETVHYAELRLCIILKNRITGVKYNTQPTNYSELQSHKISIFETDPNLGHRLISIKTINDTYRGWISFNVTSAVQKWTSSGLRILEAKISSSENDSDAGLEDESNGGFTDTALDIDTEQGKDALFVIFFKKHESLERMAHERHKRDTTTGEEFERIINKTDYINLHNDFPFNGHYFDGLVQMLSTLVTEPSNQLGSNKIEGQLNELWEINIGYPQNVAGKENDKHFNKSYNITFLTNKDNHQRPDNDLSLHKKSESPRNKSRKHRHNDMQDSRRLNTSQNPPEIVNAISTGQRTINSSEDLIRMRIRRETKSRYRRHLNSLFRNQISKFGARFKRSKKKRKSCQRKEMYVDFETIKWDKVMISPKGYQAFECTGKCYTPISEYLSPTKHAIIQTLVHTSYPQQASRACCVPTQLDPISILYWDDNGDITYDYSYEGMVVAECGCQ